MAFAQPQLAPGYQAFFPGCPRETPLQLSQPAKPESAKCDSAGEGILSPSSWESQASFDMLADFLCLADGQESSTCARTASRNFLQSPRAPIDSGRSSLDSDRSVLPQSFLASTSAFPDHNASAPLQTSCDLQTPISSQLSLRLDHEDVLSAWHKLSGGRAAFCHQQPSSTPAVTMPEASSSFVPLVPQECNLAGHQPMAGHQPNFMSADAARAHQPAKPQLLHQGSLPSTASSLPLSLCGGSSSCAADSSEPAPASRQARLDRYREKKRTRGFSGKIRYEMRKINAERRPRVKGRFVKREDTSETLEDALDPLTDCDPLDFSMITALDLSEDSYLL